MKDYEKVANTLRHKLDVIETQLLREKALCERLEKHNQTKSQELN